MKYKNLIWVLWILVLSIGVFGAPPLTADDLDIGLTIQRVDIEQHPINTEFYMHAHIYDSDTGLIIANDTLLNCSYHFYNEYSGWEHIDMGVLESYGAGMFKRINGTVFNVTGIYTALIWCDYNGLKGGFNEISFNVIDTTNPPLENFTHILFIVGIVGFVLLGLSVASWFGLMGGLLSVVYSLSLFSVSLPLGIITLGVSLLLMLGFAMKEF